MRELRHKYKKIKHSFKDKWVEIRDKQDMHAKEITHYTKMLQAKEKEIAGLKEHLDSQNDPYPQKGMPLFMI